MKRFLGLVLLLLGAAGISQAAFYTRIPYRNVAGKMQVKVSVGGVAGTFIFDTGAPVCLTQSPIHPPSNGNAQYFLPIPQLQKK